MIFEVFGYYFLIDTYFIMKNSYPNLDFINVSNSCLKHFKTSFNVFFFIAFFAISTQSFSQTTVVFNTTGDKTFTIPCGVTNIIVEAWGAGGAGGGSTNNNSRGGSGGAGGSFVKSSLVVTSGTTYNLYVAPTNNGGTYNGNKGEGSWFQSITTLFAEGGNGGSATNGNNTVPGGAGSIGSSIGALKIAGANGNDGTGSIGGAGGNGANGGGQGGASTNNNGGNGNTGTAISGGGGGAYVNDQTNRLGGNGARGEIRITYEIHTLNIAAQPQSSTNLCDNSMELKATGTNITWQPISGLFVDSSLTFPYTGGTANTVYAKPSITTNYTATNTTSSTCSSSASYEVKNYNKKFITSGDWNNPVNWSPNGVPSNENCVTILQGITVTINAGEIAVAKTITIEGTAKLILKSDQSLIVTNQIINNSAAANFEVENNGNLVQINDVVNTGNIIYKRIAPGIKGSDYVYWSSPVTNQTINSFYTSPAQGPKYSWNTLVNNGNGVGANVSQGNWQNAPTTMAVGSGYIVRGSSSFGMPATDINSTFTGIPNNGTIPVTVSRGSYTGSGYIGANNVWINNLDDNYNLIGNPYPSAINALQFLSDNSSVIEGNVKMWTHGTNPSTSATNPFYGSYAYNYSANDYITINKTGQSKPGYSSNIKAGQAFFVEMLDDTTGSNTVSFNNTQRSNAGNPYANDGFYRNSNQQTIASDNIENHRIWLDIVDTNNIAETTLVGYVTGATIAKESTYDAIASALTMGIYSVINNETFLIQGRGLPFDDNDQVAIGFNVPTTGNYSIAINTIDGLFLGTQDIYLKDELLNIYHDLKSAPYSFTATTGIHDTRFKLVYKNTVLSNVSFNENEIKIAKNRSIIEIVSGNEIMESVKVFDVRGRLLVEKSKINANNISIDTNNVQDQVLIINIVTSKGIKVTRKIL
jgi:hypothetical protein